MKKITFDASTLLPGRKMDGIGRTALGLIDQFASMDLPFELSLFSQRMRGERITNYSFEKCHLPLPRLDFISAITKTIPVIETMCRADLYHIPHNYAPFHQLDKTVVTIHDTLFFAYPEVHLGTDNLTKSLPSFAQKCRGVITCSEHSKKDIAQYMGVDPEKIFVTHWGVDHSFFHPAKNLTTARERMADKYKIHNPFFVSVSCDIGRKNTPKLVDEYLQFAAENPINDLVLVWKRPPQEVLEQIKNSPYSKKIHILGFISDEDLRDLYCTSTALIFPSLYEGFGLPVLEAMACGTAVVTTPFSSLPEVGGDAAHYIDPNQDGSIYNALKAFEDNTINREDMVQKGLAHAKQFTWERCAQKTIEIYMKLLED
jgi:glycosyltransferase involved in cell wall biosynthesis